jgi:hypothetical protein
MSNPKTATIFGKLELAVLVDETFITNRSS